MKRQALRYTLWSPGVMLLLLTACGGSGDDGEAGEGKASAPPRPQTAAERGLALATANACTACHALDGARGIGPSWLDSYGSTRRLKDGSTTVVDETYLRRAMLDPAAEVVEGYESIMVPATVTEAQIADIIAFIKELRSTLAP